MLYITYLFFIILFSYGTLGQQSPTCPTDFTFYSEENKCLRAFSTKKSFNAAMESCKALNSNSHLVFVRDEATNIPLRKVANLYWAFCGNEWVKFPAFWTAGRKPPRSDNKWNWVFANGTHVDMPYTNWRRGEPNNEYGIENCIHFLLDEKLDWNDTRCELAFCYVCEVDM